MTAVLKEVLAVGFVVLVVLEVTGKFIFFCGFFIGFSFGLTVSCGLTFSSGFVGVTGKFIFFCIAFSFGVSGGLTVSLVSDVFLAFFPFGLTLLSVDLADLLLSFSGPFCYNVIHENGHITLMITTFYSIVILG